ncbi:uncharacterized protein LOC124543461 [Vanessa cardui]|uniref:uncharacterized protein LOC124543461 n=1 Tax=Vanessa cardui TaxID=171605 RepID=UPI001F132B9E|nr:uncharacterized protein LOC124543461 [Vanessa cardui]
MAELLKIHEDQGLSVALVQEPYTGTSGSVKQYPGTKVIQCTHNINRSNPVKAAIIVFGDQFRIIQDPQLVTETESAVILEAGNFRLGVISVYFDGNVDIGPYTQRIKTTANALITPNIIIAGDVNAWSYWWGSVSEDQRGAEYYAFLNEMDYHVLNSGNTPTFEVWRGGKLCSSIVDVTACSTSLLGKIKDWKVDRTLITSDHNAITYTLELGTKLEPVVAPTTRVYNTKKANWSAFKETFLTSLASKNITPETIGAIMSGEDMESIIDAYTTSIREACETAIPKLGKRRKGTVLPWWTEETEHLKKDLIRKKRRIRNAAPHRRNHVIAEYNAAKELYINHSLDAQTKSWKEFCTRQDKESMWDGIYRVLRRTSVRKEDLLLRGPDGKTLNPKQSADLLAKTFYPEDATETDTPYHTQLRRLVENIPKELIGDLGEDDPPFTGAELEAVLKEQNPKKAPGPDGFTADICATAIRCAREVFLTIANKCLAISYFPKQWKVAHVVILNKPGKDDYTSPKSYRPIGLLSVLGKTVEKLFVKRLQWHLLPTLNSRQYGFLPQRGTEDALYDLMKHIEAERERGNSVILVSLDIEGAFDNAWWPALKNQLRLRRCPKNLYLMVNSYLQNRKIIVNYAGEKSERDTTKGCVQGSIAGPTFWNIILDPLLQRLSVEEVYCQAFADDGVLVFSGKSLAELEDRICKVLEVTVKWGEANKLNFAAHKTQAMLLTKKIKYTPPHLTMSGTSLALVDEVKLLGLTIDRRLNFNKHVQNVCTKATSIYKQLACAAKVSWGLNREIIRTIYIAAVEPIVTYGASAWAKASELQSNRKALDTLQRGFAQRIGKAYRTTSLNAVLILAGILPLDLRIREVASLYEAKRGISTLYLPPNRKLEGIVKASDLPHPATRLHLEYNLLEDMTDANQVALNITGPQIYTDGSKIEGKVVEKTNVYVSPGLGLLLNGSTRKTSMRRKIYDALPSVTVEGQPCRIVRRNNKTIVLFATDDDTTAFHKAHKVLAALGEAGLERGSDPRVISVDAMVVAYHKGETKDHLGAIQASNHHEVVVYEDRGEDLGFLMKRDQGTDTAAAKHESNLTQTQKASGSERLQQALKETNLQSKRRASDRGEDRKKSTATALIHKTIRAILKPMTQISRHRENKTQEDALEKFTAPSTSRQEVQCNTKRTKAAMGMVQPPQLKSAPDQQTHMENALREYLAITVATQKVNKDICSTILQTYQRGNHKLLEVQLKEAEAAVYDLGSQSVIHGRASGHYMAAYSASRGFIELERNQLGEELSIRATVPLSDQVVVVAKCTRIMLEDRILEMAKATFGDLLSSGFQMGLMTPAITWVNGVPGCGKTTWVISHTNIETDLIVTSTKEAVKDLRAKLTPRIGEEKAKRRIRTMASLLVNGISEGDTCTRLVVDEALMNHFGAIVMATQIARATELTLIGDTNQLPYIDRHNLFSLQYKTPNTIITTNKELLCTYRSPQDVAYALNEVYKGIYSANHQVRSLSLKRYGGTSIPKTKNTLYLTHTQAEKELLIGQGYGSDSGSCTLTIHEAQGRTYERVYVIRTTGKVNSLIQSVPHAVVALSRHTKTCVYYTDSTHEDAIARLISRAERATEEAIRDYNLKMAIWNRDKTIIQSLTEPGESQRP